MLTITCLNCSSTISLEDMPYIGGFVSCQSCEVTFEVVWLFPLEIVPVKVQPVGKTDNLTD